MKRALLFLLLARALAAEPEFVGVATARSGVRFALEDRKRGASCWLQLGEQFEGLKVIAYRPSEEALVVENENGRAILRLRAAKTFTVLDSAAILAIASREAKAREGWVAFVRYQPPQPNQGDSWVFFDHVQDGKVKNRLIIIGADGTVKDYQIFPD